MALRDLKQPGRCIEPFGGLRKEGSLKEVSAGFSGTVQKPVCFASLRM